VKTPILTVRDQNGNIVEIPAIKGDAGAPGKDGASMTVTKVTESTADGGSNVVTFSDGKTLTVRNGSKGSDGTNGQNGTDYVLTEADKQEIANMANAALATETWTFTLKSGSTVTKTVVLK
jgi:hypothetical protein